jgi:hypothetical protein
MAIQNMNVMGSVSSFVSFLTMNLLIGTAEGANVYFYSLYEVISEAFLTAAGMTTDRAQFAHASQVTIQRSYVVPDHDFCPFPTVKAFPKRGPTP